MSNESINASGITQAGEAFIFAACMKRKTAWRREPCANKATFGAALARPERNS